MVWMVSEHFDLRELVHPNIYNHPKIGGRCINWLHVNLAPTLEAIKKNFGEVITVNNWHLGGPFKDSGLRDFHSQLRNSASYSGHYYGNTADCKFKHHTPVEICRVILDNQEQYPYIARMESPEVTVTWLHIEVSSLPRVGDIVVFNP